MRYGHETGRFCIKGACIETDGTRATRARHASNGLLHVSTWLALSTAGYCPKPSPLSAEATADAQAAMEVLSACYASTPGERASTPEYIVHCGRSLSAS